MKVEVTSTTTTTTCESISNPHYSNSKNTVDSNRNGRTERARCSVSRPDTIF